MSTGAGSQEEDEEEEKEEKRNDGRVLDTYKLLEAFSCQVWSFSVLMGLIQVTPGGVELRQGRSLEVRGSLELQNGGLTALEDAWDDFQVEAFSCQVWSFLCFWGVSRWLLQVSSCVSGGPRKSGEAQSARTVA